MKGCFEGCYKTKSDEVLPNILEKKWAESQEKRDLCGGFNHGFSVFIWVD